MLAFGSQSLIRKRNEAGMKLLKIREKYGLEKQSIREVSLHTLGLRTRSSGKWQLKINLNRNN